MAKQKKRDIEKSYTPKQFADKLRRFSDAIEKGKSFSIQIAGERIHVPVRAVYNIEHERSSSEEEIEFQIKWSIE
jgi:amphi-Trp domain-containing protein